MDWLHVRKQKLLMSEVLLALVTSRLHPPIGPRYVVCKDFREKAARQLHFWLQLPIISQPEINTINWRDATHFDSEDDNRTGCWNISHHQQQSYSGLHSLHPDDHTQPTHVVVLHEKLLQFDWLRAVVFQLNLKYLHVKITNLLRVVV